MSVIEVSTNRRQPVTLEEPFDMLHVTSSGEVIAKNAVAVVVSDAAKSSTILNDGNIASVNRSADPRDAVRYEGVAEGSSSSLTNAGFISSSSGSGISIHSGLPVQRAELFIWNAGWISGVRSGISHASTDRNLSVIVLNDVNGILSGTFGIVVESEDGSPSGNTGGLILANWGTINSGIIGVFGSKALVPLTIRNNGLISGGEGAVRGGHAGDVYDGRLGSVVGAIDGAGGNDTLLGGTGNESILGGSGHDMIDGGTGADTLRGGLGDDLIFVDHATDRVFEASGEGADTVMAAVSYRLSGTAEVEWLTTADTPGTAAIDLTGSNTANAIMGNFGANRLSGLGGPDTLIGLGGQDTLSGGDGADLLLGGEGNDVLSGGAGNDRLEGGDGHDRLNGGAGLDRLGGGDGRDQFIFDTPGGTPDLIVDFNPADDTIRLSRTAFGGFEATGPLAAAAFALAADGVAGTASHRLLYDAATGMLWHDADGNGLGLATQIALLENMPANVTAGDFVIIA